MTRQVVVGAFGAAAEDAARESRLAGAHPADSRRPPPCGRRPPRSATLVLLVLFLLAAAFTGTARAEFGFQALALTLNGPATPATAPAGSHPSAWITSVDFNTTLNAELKEIPDRQLRDLRLRLPPGLLGAPALLARCPFVDLGNHACPPASQLGTATVYLGPGHTIVRSTPLYNLVPQPGYAVEVGAQALAGATRLQIAIEPDPPYRLISSLANLVAENPIYGARISIDGSAGGGPLLTLPRNCEGSLPADFEARPWEPPGAWIKAAVLAEDELEPGRPLALSDCASLPFAPSFALSASPPGAAAPARLDFHLGAPNLGYQDPSGQAEADLRRLRLTLPEGMTLNPAVAAGLAACTPAEYARESAEAPPGGGCPEAAKLGSATATTPLLEGAVPGSVYVAQPDDPATPEPGAENPFDSRYALYVIFKDPGRGILLKLAARVEADPESGRLTAIVEDIPQLPISAVDLHFRQAPRGPLNVPCGEQSFEYLLTPSAGPAPISAQGSFDSGRACRAPGFDPQLSAGSTEPLAGASSPFLLELSRGDEEAQLGGFSLTLPPGLTADFASLPLCPPALLSTAVCPSASRIGSATLAAGSGTEPLWLPQPGRPAGSVYLAGPYRGAPYSLLVAVSAIAGPLDLGPVVFQAALEIDPLTAQATISAPRLPRILAGMPIAYRAVRISLDRPGFLRNPTGCDPLQITASATSTEGATAALTNRYQLLGCQALAFAPRLSLAFTGSPARNAHPGLAIEIRPRPGEAGIAAATFTLPAGELLDFHRIGSLCAANLAPERCPPDSWLGKARIRSPLLPGPVQGPIYLRAPSGAYPDLIADLRGADQLHLVLHGRTAAAGRRLRVRLAALPDIPFTSASVRLTGGRRGIFVSSEALCARHPRATAVLSAHNAKRHRSRPRIGLRGRC